ncbi:hypothetical protein POX_c03957 [Penicillium oxalicum]|nr:hypothetical protein POX_c03957 [Penicillium oxalicum]KAI2791102.1 hypothetical protein POX_c03957 [Penicillium oxalicum]
MSGMSFSFSHIGPSSPSYGTNISQKQRHTRYT